MVALWLGMQGGEKVESEEQTTEKKGPRKAKEELSEARPRNDKREDLPKGKAEPTKTSDSKINTAATPVEQLRSSVLGADAEAKGQEVLEARRLLTKILRQHPEWALELAKMLPQLKNKALCFQMARLLGAHLDKEGVRETLIQLGQQSENELARETSIQALTGLRGDEEARQMIRSAFEDNGAGAGVRASASFALGEILGEFPPSQQANIRAQAESQVTASNVPDAVRVESIDLLDIRGNTQQKQLAYDVLALKHQATPAMALAAARALLGAGEKSEAVLPLLKQLAQQSLNGPEAKVLEQMLRDQGAASKR